MIKALYSLIIIFTFQLPAYAENLIPQTGTEISVRSLSLEEARSLALKNDKSTAAAALKLENAKLNRIKAVSVFYPDLNLSSSLSVPLSSPDTGRSTVSTAAGLSLSQKIFSGGANFAALKEADLKIRQAELDLAAAKLKVSAASDSLYFELMEAEKKLEAAHAALKVLELQHEEAVKRFEKGLTDRPALLSIKAEYELKKNQKIQADYKRLLAVKKLSVKTGLDSDIKTLQPDEQLYKTALNFAEKTSSAMEKTLNALLDLAAQHLPELKMRQPSKALAELNIRLKKASFFPSLAAGLSWSLDPLELQNGANGRFSLSMNFPVLPFSSRKADVKSAENSAEISSLAAETELEGYYLELAALLYNFTASSKQLEGSRISALYAEEYMNAVSEKFLLGAASMAQLMQAESTLSTALAEKASVEAAFYKNWLILIYSAGIDDPAAFPENILLQ